MKHEFTKEELIELVQFATSTINHSYTHKDEAVDIVDEYLDLLKN